MNAQEFHDSLVVVDGHCDSVLDLIGLSFTKQGSAPRDFFERGAYGHLDLPRMVEGNVACQIFALFTNDKLVNEARPHTWRLLEAMEGVFARDAGIVQAKKAGDILEARVAGKRAGMLSIEGGEAIGESLDELRAFYDRGVRLMGLTWNRRNAIGRGAGTGTPEDGTGGLTDFGRRVVHEMERLGMVVDASHLSDEALDDLLAIAERPVIASHSNCRALVPHRRNLTDEQAERIAATGGLIGLTFAGIFVDPDPAKVTKLRVLEHLDRLISVVGPEHVGLGSDFDGYTDTYGIAFSSPSELPWITEALLSRGHRPEAIAQIMGGNWLRVLGEICG
ncbi:MAG: dipeptidase [Spirochaetota bacterium]